jgi:hypothetical protein
MLIGRRFKLRVATIAVDGERVTVMIPAGTIVKVVSDSCEGTRMVDVLTDGRIFVMFALDVIERGDEITDRPLAPVADSESIRRKLNHDLMDADERREVASDRFNAILDDIPSGIPTPDGADRIRQASEDYSRAQKESFEALTQLNHFTVHRVVSPEMERKPSVKEKADPPLNKRGTR